MNILVVSFDALRADHLGFYGYSRPVSPAMDDFARTSLVFDDAWAASSSTPSSFAAIFTGRLATEVFRRWKLLSFSTLAEHFATEGYATGFISSNVQLVATRGFDQGFEHYEIIDSGPQEDDGNRMSLDIEVLERVRERLKVSRRPFFLWAHFLSPHAPYDYREASSHLYDETYSGPFRESSGSDFEAADPADLRRLVDLYDGEIHFADGLFGEVLAELAALGLEDDTLVVLTADHGEEFLDHGGLQHQGVHQEVLRIPLVIRQPDRSTVGSRTSLPVSHLDLAPTLAAVAGLPPFPFGNGASLLDPVDPGRLRIGVAMTHRTHHYVAGARASDKLIVSCREKTAQLFDLAEDPEEKRDLGPEHSRRLRSLLADVRSAFGGEPCSAIAQASSGSHPTEALTAEQVSQLRALGYLGGGDDFDPKAASSKGKIWAVPNPILECSGLGIGETNIRWDVRSASDTIEIRVLPDNTLFVAGGRVGEEPTGIWVSDGMGFAAVDPTTGAVLAATRVTLTRDGCP
jgi:arylsulfatase